MRGWPGFAGIVCDSITFASILEFRLPSEMPARFFESGNQRSPLMCTRVGVNAGVLNLSFAWYAIVLFCSP